MNLTEREAAFIRRRTWFVRTWPVAGSICLAAILGLAVWIWASRPMLINPWLVLSRLESGTIPASTATVMTAMLPMVFIGCILLAFGLIVFCFAAFSNERKHLRIIQRLAGDDIDGRGNGR